MESSRTEETKAELNQMPKHPVLLVLVMERKMERKMDRKVQEQGNTFMRHETLLQPRIQTNLMQPSLPRIAFGKAAAASCDLHVRKRP